MTEEYTGGSVSYYAVNINRPLDEKADPYRAECQDIIDALGMDFNEGCAFKAIWRRAAARNLGMRKKGYDEGLYDAQKVEFYGARMVAKSTPAREQVAVDGWIEHDGHRRNAPKGGWAVLRHRDGTESGPVAVEPSGSYWAWAETGGCRDTDIVAYRLA